MDDPPPLPAEAASHPQPGPAPATAAAMAAAAAAAAATTTVVAVPAPVASPTVYCHHCGADVAPGAGHDAQHRIGELEAQVRILTGKATAAADKLADYEDELRRLKTSCAAGPKPADDDDTAAAAAAPDEETKPLPPTPAHPSEDGLSRPTNFSFLSRKPTLLLSRTRSSPATPVDDAPSRRETDLLASLSAERSARQAAEGKLTQVNSELEELSVSLFQQANEMVAAERRARAGFEDRAAKWEERAQALEEKVKVLERRDAEKRKRLERLENALVRIDRVRDLVGSVR